MEHMLFHSVHQLSRQLHKRLNLALEPFNLYNAQWSVLYVLKEKGTLTQKELCEYLAVEAPPMTRMIQRLVKQGYVDQQPGEDKRKKFIKLSDRSLEEYPKWEAAVNEANQKLLELLPEDSREELLVVISGWLNGIKQDVEKVK